MKIISVRYGLIAVTDLGTRTLKFCSPASWFISIRPVCIFGVMLGPSGEGDRKAHMAVPYLPVKILRER